MENLKDQRADEKRKENMQVSLMSKFLEQQRERFDYADTAQWILDDKFDTDLIFIQDKVIEWLKTAKNENQKKVLNEMVLVCFRINSYTDQMRTLNKATVAKYVTVEKRLAALHSEMRLALYDKDQEIEKLKKDLETAKKEIEFTSK
jgi:tellurite resistance protein